ncbi:hypothetical protein [Fimbriiglobus ruber]|uniref:Uncharacterized protein n=1 Tax=Fimbriiglobus ruber TaxID=1908690 RepID=A0A225D9V2_9BACT|nr:hypothetical protein [Fimbriiglobus ruber]OWK38390.1 hypothetical protein FRUB_07510 [Fimbriiglobus ruber]
MLERAIALMTRPLRRLVRVTHPIARRPAGLRMEALEDRLVPSAPAFDYRITNGAIGSVVTITGQSDSQTAVASTLDPTTGDALAHFGSPPDPNPGLFGQGYWNATVELPPGYEASHVYSPLLNTDGNIYDAETFADRPLPPLVVPPCINCGGPMPAEISPQPAAGNNSGQPSSQTYSDAGVRYSDGSVAYSASDLSSNTFGTPWGQGRSWASNPGYAIGQHNGPGWVDTTLPVLSRAGDQLYATGTGTQATAFQQVPYSTDSWAPTLSGGSSVTHDGATGEYALTDENGNQYGFYDSSSVTPVQYTNAGTGVWGTEDPPTFDRTAPMWSDGSSFTTDVTVSGGTAKKVSLYLLDWDNQGRSERIDVIDPATNTVLDSETVSGFAGGEYLSWNISGHVQFKITSLTGSSAVLSGVFFDPASGSGLFVGSDTTTQGAWQGAYGTDGYDVATVAPALPGYATVTTSASGPYVWAAGTTAWQALANPTPPPGYDRVGAYWESESQFTVDLNLTDTATHLVSLYFQDQDFSSLSQQVELVDPVTGDVIDTRTVTAPSNGGVYLSWNVAGPVQFRITLGAGSQALVSGVFLDAGTGTAGTFAGTDTTTKGSWRGAYGSQGYDLPSPTNPQLWESLPSYAQVQLVGITPPERQGQLKWYVDSTGQRTDVTGYSATGAPTTVTRSSGSTVETWQYTYGTTPATAALMQTATLTRSTDGGVTFQPVQTAEYRYYDFGSANGNAGDLEAVLIHDGDVTGPVVSTSYYRYDLGLGANGGLKLVVTGASFDSMAAAYGVTIDTVDSLTDAQVQVYADQYYQYDGSGRVTTAVVNQADGSATGQGTYTFSYVANPHRPDQAANVWATETIETLPSGTQNLLYSNGFGETMLMVTRDPATGQEWDAFTAFDSAGRVTLTADAAAVTGYDDTSDDLLRLTGGQYQYLSQTAGQITTYQYGTATTATETTPGDVAGYLKATHLSHGQCDLDPTPINSQQYYAHTADGTTIYPVATNTTYQTVPPATPAFTDDFSVAPGANWQFTVGGVAVDGRRAHSDGLGRVPGQGARDRAVVRRRPGDHGGRRGRRGHRERRVCRGRGADRPDHRVRVQPGVHRSEHRRVPGRRGRVGEQLHVRLDDRDGIPVPPAGDRDGSRDHPVGQRVGGRIAGADRVDVHANRVVERERGRPGRGRPPGRDRAGTVVYPGVGRVRPAGGRRPCVGPADRRVGARVGVFGRGVGRGKRGPQPDGRGPGVPVPGDGPRPRRVGGRPTDRGRRPGRLVGVGRRRPGRRVGPPRLDDRVRVQPAV